LLLLVGIVAAGLVISDVVTYNALRSFLTTRVDQQLEQAAFPVGRALLSSSGLGAEVPAAPRELPTAPTGTTPFVPGAGGSLFQGGSPFGGARSDQRGLLVPPGTYGQIRSPGGKVEAHLFFSYGGKAPTAPVIPADLATVSGSASGSGPRAPTGSDHFFTASSPGGTSVSYRVLARPLVNGAGTVVVAVPLTDLESTLRRLLLIELGISALLLLGLGAVSWVMVRRDLRPLEAMTGTATAIAGGDLTQRVGYVSESNEVGQLGMAFNTMVDEIEMAFAERAASEERLRRFLADASHELRTPLTSILGYAELFDLGVRDRPEDLARSMRTIKSEAIRMGALVDDLLWLAKLDHERPLHHDRVDLVDLARQAVIGAGLSHPARRVTVVADGQVTVSGDGDRLRQVLDNLVVNALTHTPPGAAVEVRVTSGDGAAVLVVHDDGPGIDPADATRIFEPFYRSDPSRARASGGSGLGLAIVAAIVKAHHGTVASLPGTGGTFEVRLPLDGSDGAAPAPERNGSATGSDAPGARGDPVEDQQTGAPDDGQRRTGVISGELG
jgi:two-component system OmpR family sensor kinase